MVGILPVFVDTISNNMYRMPKDILVLVCRIKGLKNEKNITYVVSI